MKKDGKAEPEFVLEETTWLPYDRRPGPKCAVYAFPGWGSGERGRQKAKRYELGGNILREQQCLIWDEMPVAIINANLFF